MFKLFQKLKTKKINMVKEPFILSEDSLDFIKKYAITKLNINVPITEDILDEILQLACEYELSMIDENGDDYQHDYPEKSMFEHGDRFVSEVSGKWSDSDPNLEDLNNRLFK